MLGDTVTARQALQKAGQDGTADLKSLDTLDKLKEDAAAAYNSKDFRKVGLFGCCRLSKRQFTYVQGFGTRDNSTINKIEYV